MLKILRGVSPLRKIKIAPNPCFSALNFSLFNNFYTQKLFETQKDKWFSNA